MTVFKCLCHEHGFTLHIHNAVIQNNDENAIHLIHLIHMSIICKAIVFGSFELISQSNNFLIPLNTTVACNAIVFDSFEYNCSL